MPCTYVIDAEREIVYLTAEGEVLPYELIDTFRSLRQDPSHHPHFDLLADTRRMNPPLFDADLHLVTYYIGSLSKCLRGNFALLSMPEQSTNYRQWVDCIEPHGIKAAAFTSPSKAQQWIEAKDFSKSGL